MRYRFWLLIGSLALVPLTGWASGAGAQMEQLVMFGDSSTLTVDVVPLEAEVRLDGVPIGIAHELVARAIAVVPGTHVLEITAPGYLPTRLNVSATVDWATRIWLQLVPNRGRPS